MVNTEQQHKLLVDINGACEALSLGRTTVYDLMRQGVLTPVRVGRAVRFRLSDLEAYVTALGE